MAQRPPRRSPLPALALVTISLALWGRLPAQLEIPGFDPQRAIDELRRAARELPYVMPDELAFGREPSGGAVQDVLPKHRAALVAVGNLAWQPERLVALLADGEPMVRLLAAYGLYRSTDARFLPALAGLADDSAEVPARIRFAGLGGDDEFERVHREHPEYAVTMVGGAVRMWLAQWHGPAPESPEFAPWCTQQQELAPTADCLRLKLLLATGGSMNAHGWQPHALLEVFSAAARAPRGAAELAQIALFQDRYPYLQNVYPDIEAHLLFAARRLGRDNVLRVLRGEAPVIDGAPLARESFAGFEPGFATFVLDRPAAVGLEPADADALLRLGREAARLDCFRAAALLRPADALAILRETLAPAADPFTHHRQAACATLLWDLAGPAAEDLLTEWFHREPPGPIRVQPDRREEFAKHLLERYGAADRRLFAALVADARFDRIPPFALLGIVRTLNLTSFEPVVPDERLGGVWHPLGIDRAIEKPDAAATAFPAETAELLARLAEFRAASRARTAGWLPAGRPATGR
ncbi:MAG: hypothetical protein IPM29_24855 [Planctomycetes bacterium]|nr:hypothetical protein [Planctomycetota bacterium]